MKKAGTPTMGGVLIIISIVMPTLLWADLRHVYVWIALFALVAFGIIGFIDDYAKVMNKRNLGLTAWQKFGLQMLVAAVITAVLAGDAVLRRLYDHAERPFPQAVSAGPADPFADGQPVHLRAGVSAVLFVLRAGGGGVVVTR